MSSVTHGEAGDLGAAPDKRRRRRLVNEVKDGLRELSRQLSLLNHQVSARLDIKDADFGCLDLVNRHGPLSPSALAKQAGVHPATITGILDRLERGGWVARTRDPVDRRAVVVAPLRERGSEVFSLYAGMNASMDEICAGYTEDELTLLAEFVARVAGAGAQATDNLAKD